MDAKKKKLLGMLKAKIGGQFDVIRDGVKTKDDCLICKCTYEQCNCDDPEN